MAPAGPCWRFSFFKHFIQPLGGIVTCTPKQLQTVKEGLDAFNGYSFGDHLKEIHELEKIWGTMWKHCFAQRDLSLPVQFSLPNNTMFPSSRNISVYISWYTWFSFCRIFISALDAFQEVMRNELKLLFHANDDAKEFKSSISRAAKREFSRSTWSSCWALGRGAEFIDVVYCAVFMVQFNDEHSAMHPIEKVSILKDVVQ